LSHDRSIAERRGAAALTIFDWDGPQSRAAGDAGDMVTAGGDSLRDVLDALRPMSRLRDLPTHSFDVDAQTPGHVAVQAFHSRPDLPGAIVRERGRPLGVLSRQLLFREMSRPFAREIFLRRPISVLCGAVPLTTLALPADCSISEAAQAALDRPAALVYEPLQVVFEDRGDEVLDVHVLMLAQARLLASANAEIERQRDAARAASRLKGEFVANVSHELRTPINGIIGMTEILLGTPLEPEQREYAALVRSSADNLLALVNDLLDFERTDAGLFELDPRPFELFTFLGELLAGHRARAQAKNIAFDIVTELKPPFGLRGDALRIGQVLANLLGNAVKFTDRGAVRLEVAAEENGPRQRLRFVVRDTGIGIREQDVPRIFQPFVQADGSLARRYGGTGLGLAISRRIADKMGGQLTVESVHGVGSVFTFEVGLPAAAVAGASPAPDGPVLPVAFPIRVLLAEDHPVNQKVAVHLLETHGMTVAVVANGAQAVAMLERDPEFDLVLMDVQMPEVDGITATRAIRAREAREGGHIPIIALTAHARQDDRVACLAAGMDAYATKPIDRLVLLTLIQELVNGAVSSPAPARAR
jgi:signal transduction histidine kinase